MLSKLVCDPLLLLPSLQNLFTDRQFFSMQLRLWLQNISVYAFSPYMAWMSAKGKYYIMKGIWVKNQLSSLDIHQSDKHLPQLCRLKGYILYKLFILLANKAVECLKTIISPMLAWKKGCSNYDDDDDDDDGNNFVTLLFKIQEITNTTPTVLTIGFTI